MRNMARRQSLAQRVAARIRRRLIIGVTVTEVMMSLSVLGVGATGIISMQKTTLVANTRARNLAVASGVASSWMARLRGDAASWVRSPTGLSTLSQTKWLRMVESAPGKWFQPASDKAAKVSAMADVRGVDTDSDKSAGFCTNIRLTKMLSNLVRAEVRVFWIRNQGGGTLGGQPLCTDDAGYMNDVGQATANYHFVYLTSAMIRNDTTI
jgi:type IV pilus assembly protein PilV